MPNKHELIEKIDKKNQLIIQSLVERYNTLIDLINKCDDPQKLDMMKNIQKIKVNYI
tara:strand:- start:299 stop:469 length:171 start_codon:yes stop_codon:yes gene_type:complete